MLRVKEMKILLYDSGIGVIPFFLTLCKNQKYHDYIIEMEEDFFPLGEKKKEELEQYVREKLAKWEEQHIDVVYIICNTFSMIYHSLSLPIYSFAVYTILEENEKWIQPTTGIIATDVTARYFAKKGYPTYPASYLVRSIEEEKIETLVFALKQLSFQEKSILLGCTHFTHIAFLFQKMFPQVTFIDGYRSLAMSVPSGTHFSLTLNHKAKKWWKKFISCHKFSSSIYIDNVRWIL